MDDIARAAASLDRDRRALLVLDGVEHLTVRIAPAVCELLAAGAGLTVLATGQEVLRIYGERVVPVAPLLPPGPLLEPDVADVQDNPAVRLFTQRAHEVSPGFSLTAENVEAVVDICNLLEGVPLLVELAVRRLRLFPLPELRSWLRRGGDSHLSGPVDVPARQHTVRAIADWSSRGLSEPQRRLLGRLAVCERGVTLASAEQLSPLPSGEAIAAIEALLDKNLVTLAEQRQGDSRLVMSRTIRTYGLSLLAEAGEVLEAHQAHAQHYAKMLRGIEARFYGSEQQRWLRVAAAEHDNLAAALTHMQATGGTAEWAAVVAASLRPWLVGGEPDEGMRWFDAAAEALRGEEGTEHLPLLARLRTGAGILAAALGDHDRAAHRQRHAVALYKQLKDPWNGARASARMGLALFHCGDRAVGASLLAAARTTCEAAGDTAGSAEAALGLAEVMIATGDHAEARAAVERAVRIHRHGGEIRELARALLLSAGLALHDGDEAAAQVALRESLRLFESIEERTELPSALEEFALVIQRTAGQPQRATRLLAGAEALRRRTGAKVCAGHVDRVEAAVAELRMQLGWTVFATAWKEGLRLRPRAMAAEALSAVEPGRGEQRSEAGVLTPRQLQVALLVSEGMTNRQIAQKLCITEWTVVNHVRQVMRKLGCRSRVQVAWAVGRKH